MGEQEERGNGVQKLVKMFEARFSFSHSHSADDRFSRTTTNSSQLSARMKRRSFAKKQKPVVRTYTHVPTGSTSSYSSGSSTDTVPPTLKTFNRKAALRRPSTSDNKKLMENKVQFSLESNQGPGIFSPRTSLKRQKSVSADSLAEIRSTAENMHRHANDDSALQGNKSTECVLSSVKSEGYNFRSGLSNRSLDKGSPEILLRRLLRRSVKKEQEGSPIHTTLDRAVSDNTGLVRKQKDRFVTFSTDVGAEDAEQIRKLTRTPTPYWSQDSEENECVFDDEGSDIGQCESNAEAEPPQQIT